MCFAAATCANGWAVEARRDRSGHFWIMAENTNNRMVLLLIGGIPVNFMMDLNPSVERVHRFEGVSRSLRWRNLHILIQIPIFVRDIERFVRMGKRNTEEKWMAFAGASTSQVT